MRAIGAWNMSTVLCIVSNRNEGCYRNRCCFNRCLANSWRRRRVAGTGGKQPHQHNNKRKQERPHSDLQTLDAR